MKKIKLFFWIFGGISAAAIIVLFVARNASPVHVDVFIAEGEFSVFFIMMVSFLFGFGTCWTFIRFGKLLNDYNNRKKNRRAIEAESSLIGEI